MIGILILMLVFVLSISEFPTATRGINNDSYFAAAAFYAEQVMESQRHLLNGSQNGTLAAGSSTVTSLPQTASLAPGMAVQGSGIPALTTIVSVNSATAITLSNAATRSGVSQLFFRISTIPAGSPNTTTQVSGLAYKAPQQVDLMYSTSVSTLSYDRDGVTPRVLDLTVTVSWQEGSGSGALTHRFVTETLIGAATR